MDQPINSQTINRLRRKKILLAALMLTTVTITAWGVNLIISPSTALDDLRISEVRRGSIANTINASGIVMPVHEEQVPSPIQTRVSRVHVKAGQIVGAGELLLELDDQSIQLAIDSLEERIAQQEIRVQSLALEMKQKQKQLSSEIELLELDLSSAKVKLGRYQRLEKIGASSASDLNAAELVVKRTEIELRQRRESVADTRRAIETNIQGAELQKSILQKELLQQKHMKSQTQVRAPFAGMLTWVLADEGTSVQSGQLVAKVSELHNYHIEASISDFYARYLSAGQQVRVGYSGQTLLGHVQTILPEVQNGTLTLLITLEKPNHALLRNKLRVDTSIVTEQKNDALIADNGPAFNGKGRQDIFVIVGSVARKRELTIGLGDGKSVEIVSGVKSGERLIVSDVSRYKHLDHFRVSN